MACSHCAGRSPARACSAGARGESGNIERYNSPNSDIHECAPFPKGARFPDGSPAVPRTVPRTVPCYDCQESLQSIHLKLLVPEHVILVYPLDHQILRKLQQGTVRGTMRGTAREPPGNRAPFGNGAPFRIARPTAVWVPRRLAQRFGSCCAPDAMSRRNSEGVLAKPSARTSVSTGMVHLGLSPLVLWQGTLLASTPQGTGPD